MYIGKVKGLRSLFHYVGRVRMAPALIHARLAVRDERRTASIVRLQWSSYWRLLVH